MGRTADELASVLTTEALWEIVAVYDERAKAIEDAKTSRPTR